ncbi:hypothetical protein VOLCADRAFT_96832 [Volvox carteri f. nagariensis]|uniref:Helitron helicase-like domain-containing protein n=1 Tax=Volvox carteri f. nagariensis TaxID=3068 RepID=D8UB64_VOLCA|nr:uncharacterized protein VOLCADRAFT_96832 [Volvox carteri f. nagariensis]EFJ43117.1 hypothetical protein VOLCADRAFT_96832 [Volvox carteri f. nagariensis]|eukprot:XP_002955916.1 hypothetical protein VOLCADRAFT_96832 [Volvox carteri f. nagariensis]
MPSCVCTCCSEMKSAVQAHGYRFGDIPNVHQLRADVWRTLAVARPAQVVAWLPVTAARAPPPPEPALPWGFRKMWLNGHSTEKTGLTKRPDGVDDKQESILSDEEAGVDATRPQDVDGQHEEWMLPSWPPRPGMEPRPDPTAPGVWLVPYCMRVERSGENCTVHTNGAGEDIIMMCNDCIHALECGRIPEAALARYDGGDVPEINQDGQRLEWPTVLEANILGLGHVQQQIYRLKVKNRPSDLQPITVTMHGIAVANPSLDQVKSCQQDIDAVGAIPREAVKAMVDILALPKMHPDRRRLLQDTSPLVHALVTSLRAAAVVAAGQFLEFGEDGAPLREERVMDKWRRVQNNPYTSQALLNAVKLAFMDILFGFKPGDKRQSNPDCFCGTVFHICIKVEQSGRLALHLHGMVHLAAIPWTKCGPCLRGPTAALWRWHTPSAACGRIPEAALARYDGGDVPEINQDGQRLEWPTVLEANILGLGHVQQQIYRLKVKNRPSDLQPITVTMHGIAVANPSLDQVKSCQQDIDAVGAIPREAVKAMVDILALPKMHPDRRRLLQDTSPLVHALVTSLRAAAVVAAGQFLEFGEDGAPLREERVMDKWRRVQNNPYTSQALLNAVKLAFMDILFGFKPGDKRQSNPDCFCGTVFHICIKVEQSGRLALHLHGMVHLAAIPWTKCGPCLRGPTAALWRWHTPSAAFAPTPMETSTAATNSGDDSMTDATAEEDDGLTQAEPGSTSGTDEDIGNGDNGVQPAPPAASAGRPPAIHAPQPDGSMPAPAYDFAIVARGKPCGTGGEATDTFTPKVCLERCTQHLVAGVVGSCTHKHTDTCKRFGCAGVDGDCGMAYPRHIRCEFKWVGDSGLFVLPRYGPNIVPHCPAVTMVLGCNNVFTLACELDRQYIATVEEQLVLPVPMCDPEVLEDILVQAEVVAHRTTHYATKYVAKATSQSQVTWLNCTIMISRHFLDTAAAGGGDPAAAHEDRCKGIGNLISAANRTTASLTIGMAMASFKLAGHDRAERFTKRSRPRMRTHS